MTTSWQSRKKKKTPQNYAVVCHRGWSSPDESSLQLYSIPPSTLGMNYWRMTKDSTKCKEGPSSGSPKIHEGHNDASGKLLQWLYTGWCPNVNKILGIPGSCPCTAPWPGSLAGPGGPLLQKGFKLRKTVGSSSKSKIFIAFSCNVVASRPKILESRDLTLYNTQHRAQHRIQAQTVWWRDNSGKEHINFTDILTPQGVIT